MRYPNSYILLEVNNDPLSRLSQVRPSEASRCVTLSGVDDGFRPSTCSHKWSSLLQGGSATCRHELRQLLASIIAVLAVRKEFVAVRVAASFQDLSYWVQPALEAALPTQIAKECTDASTQKRIFKSRQPTACMLLFKLPNDGYLINQ